MRSHEPYEYKTHIMSHESSPLTVLGAGYADCRAPRIRTVSFAAPRSTSTKNRGTAQYRRQAGRQANGWASYGRCPAQLRHAHPLIIPSSPAHGTTQSQRVRRSCAPERLSTSPCLGPWASSMPVWEQHTIRGPFPDGTQPSKRHARACKPCPRHIKVGAPEHHAHGDRAIGAGLIHAPCTAGW